MTITSAVNHFIFKLNKVWKSTSRDEESIKTIMSFVEQKHKKQLTQNELFAKLYINTYRQLLEHYNTTVFDKEVQKKLHEDLDKPLSYFIKKLTDSLNESELYSLYKELDIEIKHPALVSETKKEENVNKLIKAMDDKSKKDAFIGDVWKYDDVQDIITQQVNHAINILTN